ncbi:hypothetical protein PUMCH_001589 [Australozyma saopauloensis]|uniref:Uncharacterized protein n=1 Tax=Australozyma saopauloensis TaxID=291208 RepID=A0AAX4H7Y9_9ASCO|nr:hypothetical protein PUMCH_001589 [[Candida] saopauloensis]
MDPPQLVEGSGERGVSRIHFRNEEAQTPDAVEEAPRVSAAYQVPQAPTSTAQQIVDQTTPKVDPQKDPIGIHSELITDENKEHLKQIVELLIDKISNVGSGSLPKSNDLGPVYHTLAGCNGVLLLQSVVKTNFDREVMRLSECLLKIDLRNIFNKGSSGENLELAVDLVKKLIARPGQVPTDAEALSVVDGLKTSKGRAFLRESLKVSRHIVKRVWFDMLMLACEFLCASRFVIETVSLRTWEYTVPLVQQLVKVFASVHGFKAFKFIFLFDQFVENIGLFLEHYLKSKVLSEFMFSVAMESKLESRDAIFDALWTRPGLCFVLACTNRENVPKAWSTRFDGPCIPEVQTHDVITTSGNCLKTQYLTYDPLKVMRSSPLCPGLQKQFFRVAKSDVDINTLSHIKKIYNRLTYLSFMKNCRARELPAAHLYEVMSIIKTQGEYLSEKYTETQNFIEKNCRALVSMKNGNKVTFKPGKFFELAKMLEQGYTELVKQNIASLVKKFALGDFDKITPEAQQELTQFNFETETRLSRFLEETRYIVHVFEGGRLYFEKRRNAGHETSIGDAIFLMNGASSGKNIKSTVASVQNNLLIYEDNIRHSTRDLKFSRYLNERLINEFLMTWSEELLGETSPLLDWVGDAEIAQLRTMVFSPGHVNIPLSRPIDRSRS